jgi:succinate-semialdehyde dehydrogenase / glutarate-semialdehyde dehydrogenase
MVGQFAARLRPASKRTAKRSAATSTPPRPPAIDVPRLAARLAASGPTQTLASPFTGEPLGELPTSTHQDVVAAAVRARELQRGWAARSIEDRAEVLLRFHDRLLDRRDTFIDLIQQEGGKARLSAAEEVLHVVLTARYYGRRARQYLHPERGDGIFPVLTRIDRCYVPKGLVGVIAPWNYPMTMAISDGLAALVAGNGLILKPDHQTPLVAIAAVELLVECGMPDGLWQVVHGPGPVVGPQLIDVSDYVCFTGSTATGRAVAARCADRLIGCSLELGGKNPLLVLDDADVEVAAEGAVRSSFSNAGQLCVSTERIYVAEPLMADFCTRLVARTRELRLGNSLDYEHDIGGLINLAQVQRVNDHVEDARAKGATVLTGGRRREDLGPLFYEPTVLTGVTPEMACYAGETFGPVVSVYPVSGDDEAVTRANDSEYGLNASVWTADQVRGRRVASKIKCGTVNVNEGFAATFGSIDAPMGGMKQSGLGRRQGREGIRRFVEVQSVATQAGLPIAPSHGMSAETFAGAVITMMRVFRRIGRA